jgi:hypothetical protein
MNLNSVWDLLRQTQRPAAPPYITTWNWQMAKVAVAALEQLEPTVVAGGHGVPITNDAAAQLHAFAARFTTQPGRARVVDSDTKPAASSRADWFLFALSATGVPIGIIVLSRVGRLGRLLMEVACSALGIRAVTMIAMGAPRRLNVLARLLLYAETIVDGIAALAGFWAWVWQPFVRPRLASRTETRAWRRRRVRAHKCAGERNNDQVTRVAAATWMAAMLLHVTRMAIYISPTRGLRTSASTGTPSTDQPRVPSHL